MIQLTPQQIEAVANSGEIPPTLFDPNTQKTYVLLSKDKYDELSAASLEQREVEKLAVAIDWKSAREALHPSQQWFDGDEPKPF